MRTRRVHVDYSQQIIMPANQEMQSLEQKSLPALVHHSGRSIEIESVTICLMIPTVYRPSSVDESIHRVLLSGLFNRLLEVMFFCPSSVTQFLSYAVDKQTPINIP